MSIKNSKIEHQNDFFCPANYLSIELNRQFSREVNDIDIVSHPENES